MIRITLYKAWWFDGSYDRWFATKKEAFKYIKKYEPENYWMHVNKETITLPDTPEKFLRFLNKARVGLG